MGSVAANRRTGGGSLRRSPARSGRLSGKNDRDPRLMSEMKRRMLRGDLYIADDPELAADHARAQSLLDRYNATRHDEHELRDRLLRELLGEVGEDVTVKPTFRCDYGTTSRSALGRSSTTTA
jgi:hypothetical protein